ncbi:hypothetical protein A6763_07525 [Aeromonas caviae]|nr:hypothetical protein A6763_07525 [Aeromonas caviae]
MLTAGNPQTPPWRAGRQTTGPQAAGSRRARRWRARDKALEGAGQGAGILVAEPIGDLGQREPPVLQLARPSQHHLLPQLAKAAPQLLEEESVEGAHRGAAICRQRRQRQMDGGCLAHLVQHPQQARVQLTGEGNARRERVGALQLLAKHRQIGPLHLLLGQLGQAGEEARQQRAGLQGAEGGAGDVGT